MRAKKYKIKGNKLLIGLSTLGLVVSFSSTENKKNDLQNGILKGFLLFIY